MKKKRCLLPLVCLLLLTAGCAAGGQTVPVAYADADSGGLYVHTWDLKKEEIAEPGTERIHSSQAPAPLFWDGHDRFVLWEGDTDAERVDDGQDITLAAYGTPCFGDYVLQGDPFTPVDQGPVTLRSNDHTYSFDFRTTPDVSDYMITSFYLTEKQAYFLLCPVFDAAENEALLVWEAPLSGGPHREVAAVTDIQWSPVNPPVGRYVVSTDHSFVLADIHGTVFAVAGADGAVETLFSILEVDNPAFDWGMVTSLGYYGDTLLVQAKKDTETRSCTLMAFRDGDGVVSMVQRDREYYLPNLSA